MSGVKRLVMANATKAGEAKQVDPQTMSKKIADALQGQGSTGKQK